MRVASLLVPVNKQHDFKKEKPSFLRDWGLYLFWNQTGRTRWARRGFLGGGLMVPHGPGMNGHRTAARQKGFWWSAPGKAFFPGLTVNGETDKNTGNMNQDTVIKNSCTGVVQTELFKQKRKKDLQLLAINPWFFWSRRADSNRGPADYESAALPTELRRPALFILIGYFVYASKSRKKYAPFPDWFNSL